MKRRTTMIVALLVGVLLVCGPRLVLLLRGDVQLGGREGVRSWVGRWEENYALSASDETQRKHLVPGSVAERIVQGALRQAEKGARYDASYRSIPYPMGDVPEDRGACTDVIVRALRNAGIDLQLLIHGDMQRNFEEYPDLWGLAEPDTNIDHRRTPNQMCYFRRHWLSKGTEAAPAAWRPGDLVFWRLGRGRLHCGVVTDGLGESGLPMVVHNRGRCRQEDCLDRWEIIAHFRHPRADAPPKAAAE